MTVKQKTLKRPHSSFTDAFGDERRRVITKFIDDPQLDGDNKIFLIENTGAVREIKNPRVFHDLWKWNAIITQRDCDLVLI